MKKCCKNCIWCKWICLYDEEGASPVIDYCEKNECKIEDVEASCWRFEGEMKNENNDETTTNQTQM